MSSMKPSVDDQILALRAYLYDHLIGRQRNQTFMHGQAFWTLPRDVVKSVALLSKQLPVASEQQVAELIGRVEGNIMLAQTTELLTAAVVDKALTLLDQIKASL